MWAQKNLEEFIYLLRLLLGKGKKNIFLRMSVKCGSLARIKGKKRGGLCDELSVTAVVGHCWRERVSVHGLWGMLGCKWVPCVVCALGAHVSLSL